jgi:2-ketocyclohexanecarboxyl-CoA hydrolase
MCKQYGAAEALAMGLVNKVVPAAELRAEVEAWCAELLAKSPTALRIAKQSFNADSDQIYGIGGLGFSAVELYYDSAEAKEGKQAFLEKRAPDFRKAAKTKK